MSRAAVILYGPRDREKAHRWIDAAPKGTSVTFKENKRTTDQNALLWVLLGHVSQQVEWYGQKLGSADWKDVFTASLRRARVVPGIDAGSFVPLGMRTSDMTKQELGELIELICAFGAERGVQFDAEPSPAARQVTQMEVA